VKKIKAPGRREKYSIIIASQTDARKKSTTLSLTRRTVILLLSIIVFIVLAGVGVAIYALCQTPVYSKQIDDLKKQVEVLTALRDSNNAVKSSEGFTPEESGIPLVAYEAAPPTSGSQPVLQGSESLQEHVQAPVVYEILQEQTPQPSGTAAMEPAAPSGPDPTAEPVPTDEMVRTASFKSMKSVPMKDAVEKISMDFQSRLNEQVERIKREEAPKTCRVVYDGDVDGDSDTVNNWADVVSVFMAKTTKDGQKLLTVTTENEKILSGIYYDMNSFKVYPESNVNNTSEENSGEPSNTVTIHIAVNSLTYSEACDMYGFTKKQKSTAERLMSTSYYTYFEGLLGIDVYDGVTPDQVKKIVANLPVDSKGSEIVKAALIRLGSPFSKSRRGSGNYVDCSYLTWWAYNQVGISIPTSSVEQAKYCYNNKFMVELSDMQPGDLLFWSKKHCDCGRWKEIHHAGIYIGGGNVVDASAHLGRVVIRKLWGVNGSTWRLRLCARPYAENVENNAS
jgi:cell wall-associated NlpC family hydrolase